MIAQQTIVAILPRRMLLALVSRGVTGCAQTPFLGPLAVAKARQSDALAAPATRWPAGSAWSAYADPPLDALSPEDFPLNSPPRLTDLPSRAFSSDVALTHALDGGYRETRHASN